MLHVQYNQGRRNSGSSGQWKFIKNKKIVTNYVSCCSSTMLTAKMTEIIEKHSEFEVRE